MMGGWGMWGMGLLSALSIVVALVVAALIKYLSMKSRGLVSRRVRSGRLEAAGRRST
jgi:hypothetical protein